MSSAVTSSRLSALPCGSSAAVSSRTQGPVFLMLSLSPFALQAMAKLLLSSFATRPLERVVSDPSPARKPHSPLPTPATIAPLKRSAVLLTTASSGCSRPVSPLALLQHLRFNRVKTELNMKYSAPALFPPLPTAVPFPPVMPKPPSHHCPHLAIESPSFRHCRACVPRFLPLRPLYRLSLFRFCAFWQYAAPAPRPLLLLLKSPSQTLGCLTHKIQILHPEN